MLAHFGLIHDFDKSTENSTLSPKNSMEEMTIELVSRLLNDWLSIKGNTKASIVKATGITRHTVTNLEKLNRANFTFDTISKILNHIGYKPMIIKELPKLAKNNVE